MERLNDHSGLKPERIYRLTACFLLEGQELMISTISLSYFRKPADKYKFWSAAPTEQKPQLNTGAAAANMPERNKK